MTASERLIKLLAVYMLNKVFLPCGNNSEISSGGEWLKVMKSGRLGFRHKLPSTHFIHEDVVFKSWLGLDVSKSLAVLKYP